MLSGWTWCIPIPDKTAPVVIQAYLKHVHHVFGPSHKILSDNGTEFSNKLFETVAKELGVEHKIYSPPYRPQSNGRIEGFHAFLKTCLAKHVSPSIEWDEVCTLATAAYNFLPNEHSRESPFFIMFGRDPRLPLTELFQHKLRYLGTDETVLSLQALRNMYLVIAENLCKARERNTTPNPKKPTTIQQNQLVTLKVHIRKTLDPWYEGTYRVIRIKGNQVELARNGTVAPTKWAHISHLKPLLQADEIIEQGEGGIEGSLVELKEEDESCRHTLKNSGFKLFAHVTGSASASACAVVHYRLITYATYMRIQAPHVHPGTAAVNQTACNFPIKGRAFAIDLHSKPEKPTVNISNRNYKISKTVCSILDPRKALTFHYKF